MRGDAGVTTMRGRSNAVVEVARRMAQHEEEWKDRCAALQELRRLLRAFEAGNQAEDGAGEAASALFAPDNLQVLTQPFRSTLTDLRSAVVKEACAVLADLAQTLGPARSKILIRDLFPTLVDARGTGNKVNTSAVHECIKNIVEAAPGRHVLAPILQALASSKNREVRESCILYVRLALSGWSHSVLDQFKAPLQTAIAAALSDASPKGRETARECYWIYIGVWPELAEKLDTMLSDSVKKHLKRSHKDAISQVASKPSKRRHLATITNTVGSSAEKETLSSAAKRQRLPSSDKKDSSERDGTRSTPVAGLAIRSKSPSQFRTPTESSRRRTLASHSSFSKSKTPSTPNHALLPTSARSSSGSSSSSEGVAKRQLVEHKDLQPELDALRQELEITLAEATRYKEQWLMQREEYNQAQAVATSTQSNMSRQLQAKIAEVNKLQNEVAQLSEQNQSLENSVLESLELVGEKDAGLADLNIKLSKSLDQIAYLEAEAQRTTAQGDQTTTSIKHTGNEDTTTTLESELAALSAQLASVEASKSEALGLVSEKDERVTSLESELSSVLEKVSSLESQLSEANAATGDRVTSLLGEKESLEATLGEQKAAFDEQKAAFDEQKAAFDEQKAVLESELAALSAQLASVEASKSEALGLVNEKDERVTSLESELSSVLEKVSSLESQLSEANAATGDRVTSLLGEKESLEATLGEQKAAFDEQKAAFDEQKAVLESELAALSAQLASVEASKSEALGLVNEKDERVTSLESELSSVLEKVSSLESQLSEANAAIGGSDTVSIVPVSGNGVRTVVSKRSVFSISLGRDRAEIEEEQRRQTEEILLRRRMRRQARALPR